MYRRRAPEDVREVRLSSMMEVLFRNGTSLRSEHFRYRRAASGVDEETVCRKTRAARFASRYEGRRPCEFGMAEDQIQVCGTLDSSWLPPRNNSTISRLRLRTRNMSTLIGPV